jgi:PAS domain-containing protein
MTQREVELILLRRWASYLDTAVFLVGAAGELMYFNHAAAQLLGAPFDDAGEMSVAQLGEIFDTATVDGQPLPAEELPIGQAVSRREPTHGRIRFRGLDDVWRVVDVTALPLNGQGDQHLGTIAFFWTPVES